VSAGTGTEWTDPKHPTSPNPDRGRGQGHASRDERVTPADLTQMREWLADAATFDESTTSATDYLDADLIGDHDVLHQIEHGYPGRSSRGITAFLQDGPAAQATYPPAHADASDGDEDGVSW
jgi:hypothetical protein